MAGWSWRASGNSTDERVLDWLEHELHHLTDPSSHDVGSRTFERTEEGWQASSHGSHPDPGAHVALHDELAGLLSTAAAQTGSSEFTSPYIGSTNLHTSSPGRATGEEKAGQPEAEGSPAGDPASKAPAPAE